MKMNTIMRRLAGYLPFVLILVGMAACESNSMFEKEQYKKVVYVLSGNDLTYGVVHSLNTPTSTGYISVCVGGTNMLDHDITVTLEKDPDVLSKYNHSNFDLDESKYAKELKPERYKIASYTTVLKAGSQDPYVKVPVEITPEGLSPDTTYLIPLRIKEDASFEMNPDKSQVLYKVYIANDFTSQEKPTVAFMRGTQIEESEKEAGEKPRQMSGNKTFYPLTKRTVRVNAALENSANKLTEDLINRSSLIMEIKEETATTIDGMEYNPIVLKPYNTKFIQVEEIAMEDDEGQMISAKEANRYVIEEDDVIRYYFSYRYRTLRTAATDDAEAEWNEWVYVYENMKVL